MSMNARKAEDVTGSSNLRNIRKLFWKLLPAQIFVVISSFLSVLVNGLIIGNYLSNISMVAMGLVTPLTSIITSVATIVSGGAGILCGNYMGKGDSEKVNQVYTVALQLLVVFGIVITAFCLLFTGTVANLLNANAETFTETVAYIRGVVIGVLPMLIMPCLMTFLQMCNKSGISLLSAILLAVVNAVLGLMNVHLFHGGIFGIGIVSSLSRYIIVAWMFFYIATHKDLVHYVKHGFEKKMAIQILKYGSPASLASFLYATRNIFINSYALKVGGVAAVNALAILGSCGGLFDSLQVGVSNTYTMLVSVFVGERDEASIKGAMKVELFFALIFSLLKFAVVIPFGASIARLFGAAGEVVPLASSLLFYYAMSAPFNFVTLLLMGVQQTLGRVKLCNSIYPVNCIIVPFFCCAFLSKVMGITAIWSCYYLAEIVTILVFIIVAAVRVKRFPVTVDDIINLPPEFNTENKFSMYVDNIDQAVDVSQRVQSFCIEHGIDNRRSMLAALCMEELASNVIQYGFGNKKGKHTIDIFTCVDGDEVSMRLRDDCKPFDPRSRYEMFNPEDPLRAVGIRMVAGFAKEMNYYINFGMNITTIKI